MRPAEDLKIDLLETNRLLAQHRERVPRSKRASIPVGGFTFALPQQRNKSGTDELLLTALRRAPNLGPIITSSFDEAFYWENQHFYFPEESDVEESWEKTGEHTQRTVAPASAHTYLCPVPPFGDMGHSEFENLAIGLRAAANTGLSGGLVCAALAGIACMTPFKEVHLLEIDGDGVVRRHPPQGWASFEDSSNLHLGTNTFISYQPPEFIVRGLADFQRANPRTPLPEEQLDLLLKGISPFVTIASLQRYLFRTGCDVWGYSPAIPALSYRGIGRRPGVFASYVRGSQIFSSLSTLYDLLDPGYGSRFSSPPNGFGCGHVPKTEEVCEFVAAWRSLLQISPNNSLETLRNAHNGVVAGLHLLGCILLSGTRNYPGAPPVNAEMEGAFSVNREKEHAIPTVWSAFLRSGLAHYRGFCGRIEGAASLHGRKVPRNFHAGYCFWGTQDEPIDVSATAIAGALANCSQMARWAGFHPNAFRALGMTTLYEENLIHSHDIERFFGRSLTSLAPLTAHRLEAICPKDVYEHVESHLRKSLRL